MSRMSHQPSDVHGTARIGRAALAAKRELWKCTPFADAHELQQFIDPLMEPTLASFSHPDEPVKHV
jgi:hypothetical protein